MVDARPRKRRWYMHGLTNAEHILTAEISARGPRVVPLRRAPPSAKSAMKGLRGRSIEIRTRCTSARMGTCAEKKPSALTGHVGCDRGAWRSCRDGGSALGGRRGCLELGRQLHRTH
uniref:Uncharacterized protein n=1 Tax=Coccolithus braarudii TaxID=221442 RepID=A0A7S0LIH1_9EUKA